MAISTLVFTGQPRPAFVLAALIDLAPETGFVVRLHAPAKNTLFARAQQLFRLDAKKVAWQSCGMKQDEAIAALEQRASDLGVKLYRVCQDAQIAPSTFYRWKTGAKASHDNIAAVTAALDSIERLRA